MNNEESRPRVVKNDKAGRYEVFVGTAPAGYVTFSLSPGSIEFAHTVVDPEFEGRGLGSLLAAAALDDARAAGLTVVPTCPFIAAYIDRHPEYASLVSTDQR